MRHDLPFGYYGRTSPPMPLLLEEFRAACRSLIRAPGYTAFAVALMTAGIGTTVAVFSLLHSVVLRPLPYPEPHRLVGLSARNPGQGLAMPALSASDFRDFHSRARSFSTLAAYRPSFVSRLPAGGEAEQWVSALVTEDFFRVFGVAPSSGRLPRADEHALGSPRVAVLSHAAWRRHFGAREEAVGRTLVLDGEPVLVIGVMPDSFREPEFVDVWLPFSPEAPENLARDSRFWTTVGRLAPGTGAEAAAAEAAVVAEALAAEFPATNRGWTVSVQPLREMRVAGIAASLALLFGAVGLVLALACANLANLQLARGVSRLPEFAVRLALGASPRTLARVALWESAIVALIGGALGAALAGAAVPAAAALLPVGLVPRSHALAVDGTALGVALVAALFATLLSGLLPAWQAWRTPVNALLKTGGARAGTGRFAQRAQNALVAAQVALTLVVLATAGSLARSLLYLEGTPPGFDPRGVLAVRLAPPENRWQSLEELSAYYDRALAEVSRLPGVRSAALSASAPLCGITLRYPFTVEGLPPSAAGADDAVFNPVSPGFTRMLGIPLVRGRDIDESDTARARKVCVINRTLAERLFPGTDPIGRRLRMVPWLLAEHREIVGVVGDVRQDNLSDPPPPQVYVPQAQSPWFFSTLLVRSETGSGLAPAVEAALRRIDPGVSFTVRALEDNVALTTAVPRLRTALFATFGAAAFALSALGIYAGVRFAVSQRTREIGVRFALGATPQGVFGDVLRRAGLLAVAGGAAGLLGSLALAEVLRVTVHGLQAFDLPVLAAAAVGVPVMTLLAAVSPALAASRLDPARALQTE